MDIILFSSTIFRWFTVAIIDHIDQIKTTSSIDPNPPQDMWIGGLILVIHSTKDQYYAYVYVISSFGVFGAVVLGFHILIYKGKIYFFSKDRTNKNMFNSQGFCEQRTASIHPLLT
ncbi:hypothetical protein ACJX0J_011848 [Zea mays]